MIDLLIGISILWLIAASITDIRKREISDWLSFSLFAIGLFFAIISSITQQNYNLLITTGVIFLIFLIAANILYYLGIFGGGDAKLLIALSTVLPQLTFSSIINLPSAAVFLLNCTLIGAAYGITFSIVLALKHKKEFAKKLNEIKFPVWPFLIISVILAAIAYFTYPQLMIISAITLLFPFIYVFSKSIESVALVKTMDVSKLTEGDWLVHPIKVGSRLINARAGLSKKDIELLKKYKIHVVIKEGIPFIPVFLVAFILSLWLGNLFELFIPFA